MLKVVEEQLKNLLKQIGVKSEIEFSKPPKPEMGDVAFACFGLSGNPEEEAKRLVERFKIQDSRLIEKVQAFGPYVNFFFNINELANLLLKEINKKDFGKNKFGKEKKYLVEFACPNTHKQFHIGHLRNTITGESIVRVLENAGYKVTRANYQGDVGMHIAKCIYAISKYDKDGIDNQKKIDLNKRIKYLGEMYARGAQEFEDSEKAREKIGDINTMIYEDDKKIKEIYTETRKWSLEYFEKIYKRLDTKFDKYYFESEIFKRGVEIVNEFLDKGIFEKSQGAIIFPGSKYDLHDRVFINSKGYPTYEAKDLALAEKHFKENKPDKILHVVAREQSGYFKVLFKALESTLPKSKDKEKHLVYGWVSLKYGKMSSRTGQVVLGERLLDEVKEKIIKRMKKSEVKNVEQVAEKISTAAVKYAFLKIGINNDIAFDLEESISTTGDSGPYLLYIVARIKSILKKEKGKQEKVIPKEITSFEKDLLVKLSNFEEVAQLSAENLDPSKIAKYLFELAQSFNSFYENCPVLKAEKDTKAFRLHLISQVEGIMIKGLDLLGIETVDAM